MFIPPTHLKNQLPTAPKAGSPVRLRSSHLLIDYEVAQKVFGDTQNIYAVFYKEHQTLMLASVADESFKQLHKAAQHMLKDRNLHGDKSIAFHEMLIDNQLDAADRDLNYELEEALGILKVMIE